MRLLYYSGDTIRLFCTTILFTPLMIVLLVANIFATVSLSSQAATSLVEKNPSFTVIVDALDDDLGKEREVSQIIANGVKKAYAGDYRGSLAAFSQAENLAPDHPIAYLHSAVIYYLIMVDFRDYSYKKKFEDSINTTIRLGSKWARTHPQSESFWANFYAGTAFGTRGLLHASYDNFIRASLDGLRGVSYMKEIIEKNTNFYDAYYGLGFYEYWYANILGRFMSSYENKRRRALGINQMKTAFTKGSLTITFAAAGLIEIYTAEKDFESGTKIALFLRNEYPNFFNTYKELSKFYRPILPLKQSISYHEEILKRIKGSEFYSLLSSLELQTELAYLHYAAGNLTASRRILAELISNEILEEELENKDTPKLLHRSFKKAEDLYEKIK